ncbi:MAG: peptidoglycan DD-metalloendopeptidase family protein [Alphaproteobacteria bacterium]|nr:peptidoglycan DD-metalloendopeptidase family protein [Alphaproteobacteria bacterium]
MNKIVSFSIAFTVSGLLLSSMDVCYAKDISENDVKKIEAEAKQKVLESRQLQAQAIQLNLELSKIDKTVITLAQKIQNNEKRLSDVEGELEKLKNVLKIKEAEFVKENDFLVQTLAALQNMSLNPSESVILQPISPIDIIRSAILLRETVPFLNNKSSKLKVDLDSIYEQKKKIESTLSEAKEQKKVLEKQQAEMRQLMTKKSNLRKEVETKGAETQKVADNLISQAKSLRELLDELERQKEIARKKKEEAERLAALRRQQELQKNSTVSTAHVVDKQTHASIKKQVSGTKFAQAKGTLHRPVSGAKTIEYGQLISKGVTAKGITYKTRAEAQVTSLFDGTVIFSGPFKGYGNIIIVEHGDGYLSLLAGLGRIDCDVGQKILTGEPVGTMPNDKNAKLYVEIRKNRHPINPSPWIAG